MDHRLTRQSSPPVANSRPEALPSTKEDTLLAWATISCNFQAVLVTTGVAMLQGVTPETPPAKQIVLSLWGWGWIPPRSDNQVGREFPHIQAESPPLLAQVCLVV